MAIKGTKDAQDNWSLDLQHSKVSSVNDILINQSINQSVSQSIDQSINHLPRGFSASPNFFLGTFVPRHICVETP